MTNSSFLSRRTFLAAAPSLVAVSGIAKANTPTDARLSPRIIGSPTAPVLVQEWFSLTCTHCAHFATEEFPKIHEQFIDTGKIRYQFHDFPLDQIGLIAAMIARSLPASRYETFILSLFSRQMQWAFSSGDPLQHLKQEAALAGISPQQFDAIRQDKTFAKALYDQAQLDGSNYNIQGTPYFRFNNNAYAQDPETVEKFAELVSKA
ncbi:thioredoxin domain-containing protein [Saccharibacter sp. 17.LH.SD]|uniref:thioredoxin domain-containing protein n=1 Tax=Saccharibacter sp. 17.LH.SD TaxID=2689393 RepID=UPI0013680FE7|nr:thioredoxin domain-containing protein [Saccharibacter sp. 17.LH.SD]MXV44510.1 thioredoxin domain-containing protein [Saccharibacter sp. 17.LH.SD]